MSPARSLITLMPGELYFGHGPFRVRTLLGSCVAMVLWHPHRKLAGMCHYVLPERKKHQGEPDGRYADEAMEIFAKEFRRHGTVPSDYQVQLYGAANMFKMYSGSCADDSQQKGEMCEGCVSVACRNRFAAYREVKKYGLLLTHADLGGYAYRMLELNTLNGKAAVDRTRATGQ